MLRKLAQANLFYRIQKVGLTLMGPDHVNNRSMRYGAQDTQTLQMRNPLFAPEIFPKKSSLI